MDDSIDVKEVATPTDSPPQDIDNILKLLPACQRCKRLRRRCDTRLPSCRLCEKAHTECYIFDHALQVVLPRSYVRSLVQRLEALKSGSDNSNQPSTSVSEPSIVESDPTLVEHGSGFDHNGNETGLQALHDAALAAFPINPSLEVHHDLIISPPQESSMTFDKIFRIPIVTGPTSRYFGSSSVLSLAVEVLSLATDAGYYTPTPLDATHAVGDDATTEAPESGRPFTTPPRERVLDLLRLYMSSTNVIYPFIDGMTVESDIDVYFGICENGQSVESLTLEDGAAYRYFRTSMACAIACALKGRYQRTFIAWGNEFYAQALKCVEEVTSEVSPQSLQALLLLILHCLFYPRGGDVWKLLDFACRLSVELGYHTENDVSADVTYNHNVDLRRSTFWGLYTIERIVGQLFGRPSDLPEQIITTEYPSIVAQSSIIEKGSQQLISAAQHYRLVYLRSEIYRECFLPANPPLHDLQWYESKYFILRGWYTGIDTSVLGVGTATCIVAFHSSTIFLLQPLLMRALKSTRNKTQDSDSTMTVFSDSFYSACELIRTYEDILRAPEDTELGTYPMTFLSAHYIWLAAMTLMAHILLSLDGRIDVLPPLYKKSSIGSDSEYESRAEIRQNIDYSRIFETSASCLILLSWCAEQWHGMRGMLDAYQKLSNRILPLLFQKGLV